MRKYTSHTIEDLKLFAINKHDGKCLSKIYTRNDQKYLWKCKIDVHNPFESRWESVKRGRWCKSCSIENLRMDFGTIKSRVIKLEGN
jgi:hypothetical protein